MRLDLFSFRAKIKIKNFMDKITPEFIIIWRIRTRKFFKRNYLAFSKSSDKILSKKKEQITSFFKKIKDFLIRTYVKLKAIFAKIKLFFSSIKKIFKKSAPTPETKIDNKEAETKTEEKNIKVTILEKLLGLLWHEPKLLLLVKNEFKDLDQTLTHF